MGYYYHLYPLILYLHIGMIVHLPPPSSSEDPSSTKCEPRGNQEHFRFLGNTTCLPCPSSCVACHQEVSDANYPCKTCHENYFLKFKDHQVPSSGSLITERGAMCSTCQEAGYFSSQGSIRVSLIFVSSSDMDGYEGKLQIYFNGSWGSVCDDMWTMENTRVVCRELGLGGAVAFYTDYDKGRGYFTNNAIVMDDVQCSGDEDSLLHCKYLGPSTHNCARTETVGVLCSGPDTRRRCVRDCSVGQYGDHFAQKCFPCNNRCLDCFGRAEKCTLCEKGRYRTQDDNCVLSCGDGNYGNMNRQFCEPCSTSCLTCADGLRPDICLSCHGNRKLYNKRCLDQCPQDSFLMEDTGFRCVPQCPLGYVSEAGVCVKCSPKCRTCSEIPENCTACQDGLILQYRQAPGEPGVVLASCQRTCDMGHYPDAYNICQLCLDPNCRYCYLGGHFCLQCHTDFRLEFHTCVQHCSSGLFAKADTCSPTCQDGFYGNMQTDQCEPCPANCRHCESATWCEICYDGFYLKDRECVQDCGNGFISVSSPPSSDVRLVGGRNSLEGRIELYYSGIWGHICGSTWSLDAANVVCSQLKLGQALRMTGDDVFGGAGIALASQLSCVGNETSLWQCMHDIPAPWAFCDQQVAGVYCSGPDLGSKRECRVKNDENCDITPCFNDVTCVDFPEENAQYLQGSYCGACPVGFTGNGRECTVVEVSEPVIIYPSEKETRIDNWPEGVLLSLPCVATGTGSQHYTVDWYIDEEPVQNSDEHRLENDGSLTLFHPVGERASGIYTCIVHNGIREEGIFYKITVQERVRMSNPPQSLEGRGRIVLTCDYTGRPKASVTWYKDGHLLHIDETFYQIEEYVGYLIIQGDMSFLTGRYMCVVRNQFSSTYAEANVTIRAPARILQKEQSVVAVLGRSFKYRCMVSGGPLPTIHWKRGGDHLPNDTSIWSSPDGTLHLSSVEHKDGGIYTCVAINNQGPPDSWDTNITVVEYPEVRVTPEFGSVALGDNAEFHCEAHGLPTPQVRWAVRTRTGQDGKYQWTAIQDSVHSLLTLSDVTEEDSGMVLCSAINPAGSSNFTAILQVRVPPRLTYPMLPVALLGGWLAHLPWMVHGVPAPNISIYKENSPLDESKFNITKHGVYFTPVYPSDSGVYTLQSSNSEGELTASATLTVIENYPQPTRVTGQLTNLTLTFHGVSRSPDGAVYEVWVVVFNGNKSYADWSTSPLDLSYDNMSTNSSYLAAIFDKLPDNVVVGDGRSYTSQHSKMTVQNVPLSGRVWHALCLRVMVPEANGFPARPLGATHYLFTFTALSAARIDDSVPGWQIALAVIGGILLAAILAVVVYCLWRCRDTDNMEAFVKTLKMKVRGRSHSVDGPLDVEGVLDQFSPHPSPTHLHRTGSGPVSRKSPQTSSSTSAAYIPTEDEIEKLEKMAPSPGIRYYEDDNWISRVPQGVLSISNDRLDRLKHHFNMDNLGFYRQRASSDPALSPRILRVAVLNRAIKRINSDPMLSTDSLLSHSSLARDNKAFEMNEDDDLRYENGRVIYHRNVKSECSKSRASRHSDSGFESEQIYRGGKYTPRSYYGTWTSKEAGIIGQDDQLDFIRKHKWVPSTWKYKHGKKRKEKKMSRGLSQWREKGAEIISWGRRWARHVLERGNYSDNESICSSGDSDIEMQERGDKRREDLSKYSPETSIVDQDNTYIDPDLIVSVPRPTITRPQNEYSSPSKTAAPLRAINHSDSAMADIHNSHTSYDISYCLTDPVPSTSGRNPEALSVSGPQNISRGKEHSVSPVLGLQNISRAEEHSVSTVVEESERHSPLSQPVTISDIQTSRSPSLKAFNIVHGATQRVENIEDHQSSSQDVKGARNYLTLLDVAEESENTCKACSTLPQSPQAIHRQTNVFHTCIQKRIYSEAEAMPPPPPRPDADRKSPGDESHNEEDQLDFKYSHEEETLLVRHKRGQDNLSNGGYSPADSGTDKEDSPAKSQPKNKSIKGKPISFKNRNLKSSVSNELLPQNDETTLQNETYLELRVSPKHCVDENKNNRIPSSYYFPHHMAVISHDMLNGNVSADEDEIRPEDSRSRDGSVISMAPSSAVESRPPFTRRSTDTSISAAYSIPKPGKLRIPQIFTVDI